MQRQGVEIMPMAGIGAEDDFFRLYVTTDYNTIDRRKVVVGIEIIGQHICCIGDAYLFETVEAIYFDLAAIVTRQHIPAVFKELYTVRLNREAVAFVVPEGTVGDIDHPVRFHRLEQGCKAVAPRGYFINKYAPLQRKVLADKVAHGKGVEHPLFQPVLVDSLGVGYVIEITANLLAVDDDAELVEYCIAPAVECRTVERVAAAQIFIALPFVG